MVDYRLTEKPPLGVEPITAEGIEAAGVTGLAIVSAAVPQGGEEALSVAVSSAFGTTLPAVGKTSRSEVDGARFLGTQPGQYLVLFECDDLRPAAHLEGRIGGTAYLTDQSDGWATVRVCGRRSREALERICPVDLDPEVFAVGAVASTLMEHLGVTIIREDEDGFLLMSARSSAQSFWHAVEQSIRNIT